MQTERPKPAAPSENLNLSSAEQLFADAAVTPIIKRFPRALTIEMANSIEPVFWSEVQVRTHLNHIGLSGL